jgi:hypothetical protein
MEAGPSGGGSGISGVTLLINEAGESDAVRGLSVGNMSVIALDIGYGKDRRICKLDTYSSTGTIGLIISGHVWRRRSRRRHVDVCMGSS